MDNVLRFPSSTIVDKGVPKNAFFKRAPAGQRSSLQRWLTDEFESITWLYKLTAATLCVSEGTEVVEIDVFYCRMKGNGYNPTPFSLLDALFPRHTLFVVEYGDSIDILMHHKKLTMVRGEQSWQCGAMEVMRSVDLESVPLHIETSSIDAVYYGLLSNVSGLAVHNLSEYEAMAALCKRWQTLAKQVTALQNKIRKERQFNRQIEMNTEARALKKQMAELEKQIIKI